MTKARRSISPQSTEGNTGPSTKKTKTNFRLSKLLNFFKSDSPEPNHSQLTIPGTHRLSTQPSNEMVQFSPDLPKISSELDMVDSTPLASEYSSSKKKRLSVQGHLSKSSDHVPRSSLIANNSGFYQSYYDNLQTEREELSNDLERRMSTIYDDAIMKDGVGSDNSYSPSENPVTSNLKHSNIPLSRDGSPSLGLVKQNSGLPNSSNLIPYNLTSKNDFNSDIDSPVIVEHELAPLYTDAGGNIARPPFINLDPRERYHLLRLKKSIEASTSLKRSLKFMINPEETRSEQINNNKVNTSTQTHDISYVSNKLNFYNTKKKLTEAQKYRVSKKPQISRGFHSGGFFYDLKKVQKKSEKRKHQLDGYLGAIKKPEFHDKNDSRNQSRGSELEQGNDEDLPVNRLSSSHHKSTDDRVGLNESLKTNRKPTLTLDEEYISQHGKLSNIIKVKELGMEASDSPSIAKISHQKDRVPPSSGFKFQVNHNDMDAILTKHREDKNETEKIPEKSSATNPGTQLPDVSGHKRTITGSTDSTHLFGKLNSNKQDNHPQHFSINASASQPKRSRSSDEEPKSLPATLGEPKSSSFFGAKPSSSQNETKMSAKTSNETNPSKTPSFSFGAVKPKEAESSDKKGIERSLFGDLGKTKTSSPLSESTSKPLFGIAASNETETSKPLFGKPDLALSSETKGDSSVSMFGNAKPSNPLLGDTSSENKGDNKSSFFGSKAPSLLGPSDTKNSSSFPLFGATESTQGSSKRKLEGSFSNKEGDTKSSFPNLSDKKSEAPLFGGATPTNDVPSKAAFSFSIPSKTNESEKKSTFSFSGVSDGPLSKKPVLTFGGPSNDAKKADGEGATFSRESSAQPAFNLGNTLPQQDLANKPKISFGNSSAPAFGGTPNATNLSSGNDSVKHTFSFGQKDSTPAFGTTSSTPANRSNTGTPPLFGGAPRPGFANTSTTPAFGGPTSNTTAPFNTSGAQVPSKSNFEFNFGATTLPSLNAPQTTTSGTPAFSFGGNSTSSTPAAPTLAAPNQIAAPQPSFGGFGQQQQQQPQQQAQPFKFGQSAAPPPAFSFSTGGTRGNTPDHQGPSMFGQQPAAPAFGFSPHAGTPTPPMFGGGMNMNASNQQPQSNNMGQMNSMGGTQQQPYTPPSVANRKILPIRQRRR